MVGQAIMLAGLMSRAVLARRAGHWTVAEREGGLVLRSDDGLVQEINESEEIRAFGFSDDGMTLVVGTPSDLTIYRHSASA